MLQFAFEIEAIKRHQFTVHQTNPPSLLPFCARCQGKTYATTNGGSGSGLNSSFRSFVLSFAPSVLLIYNSGTQQQRWQQ